MESVENPEIPYMGVIKTFSESLQIQFQGATPLNADRFNINFYSCPNKYKYRKDSDIALSLTVHLKSRHASINSRIVNAWGDEEISPTFLKPSDAFEILVSYGVSSFEIMINGNRLHDFPHRISDKAVTHLTIDGDVTIHNIFFKTIVPIRKPYNKQEGLNNDLITAAVEGCLYSVNKLLEQNVDVNVRDLGQHTPLMIAAEEGHVEIVKRLLQEKRININATERTTHSTALHFAAQTGFLEIVKLLVEHKADVNQKMDEGFTPLHRAIQMKHVDVAMYLIQSGANIFIADELKWTPLHNASYNGCSFAIVKELVKRGANVNSKVDDGRTPLHFAAEFNFHEVAKYLIDNGAQAEATDNRHWTPLHNAAYDGNLEVVKILFENNVNMDVQTIIKRTAPLHFASDHNHIEVVEILLKKGANVNIRDHTDWTPLHFAASKGHSQVCEVLIKHGADVDAVDQTDCVSALHLAAQYGHSATAKLLIVKGINVNAKIRKNDTPVHLAVLSNNEDIIKLLLRNEAYFDSNTGNSKSSPLDYARIFNRNRAYYILSLIEGLFKAIKSNNLMAAKQYINKGAIVNCKSVEYESPLLFAVECGYVDIVEHLLEQRGVNVNITNANNTTSLHIASKSKNYTIVTVLLKRGAIFDAKDVWDKTPLDYAIDLKTISLLKFTAKVFADITCNGDAVIEEIRSIKDEHDVFSAIVAAHNKDGHTLMQVAVLYSKLVAGMLLQVIKKQ